MLTISITYITILVGAIYNNLEYTKSNVIFVESKEPNIIETQVQNTIQKPIQTETPSTTISFEILKQTEKPKQTETPKQQETDEPIKDYTEKDLYYLAAAVCREAGGASEEIQLLVANVIINRVNSPHYPNTIYDVLTDYKQYGTMWKYGISFPKWANTEELRQPSYDVAKRILEGERVCPENVLYQAEFKQGSGVYKEFPGYYFCYY